MSRLVLPVKWRRLSATGDVLVRVELDLLLKTNAGGWAQEDFLVDTGSEIATFPAALAKKHDLPMPISPSPVAHSQTGLVVRSGLLRFQVVGMDQTEYVVPCYFLGDPDVPYAGPKATAPRKLLQPLALTAQLRFTFEDNRTPGIPHGEMTVEKK
jgi:hypothetical protein